MAMTPEGRVKKALKEILATASCHAFWPVQTGFGGATLDCITARPSDGHVLAIETKAPGGYPTPRQINTARDMMARGWLVVFYDGSHATERLLRAWLSMPDPRDDTEGLSNAIRKHAQAVFDAHDKRSVAREIL